MIYALQRVKQEFWEEIKRYDLTVDPEKHAVGWKHGMMVLQPYSSRGICRAAVKKYIKLAREAEQRAIDEKQAKLL